MVAHGGGVVQVAGHGRLAGGADGLEQAAGQVRGLRPALDHLPVAGGVMHRLAQELRRGIGVGLEHAGDDGRRGVEQVPHHQLAQRLAPPGRVGRAEQLLIEEGERRQMRRRDPWRFHLLERADGASVGLGHQDAGTMGEGRVGAPAGRVGRRHGHGH
jgi:hypothetical protein